LPNQSEEEKEYIYDNKFMIRVRAYSEDPEMLNKILENPPEWLIEKEIQNNKRIIC
jgi:hypothetical protein